MTIYAVLLTGDETAWDRLTPEEQAATFGRHEEFGRLLEEQGHRMVEGRELEPSAAGRTMRLGADGAVLTTDGPYAEGVEQLGAFYLVQTDDLDGLVQICGALAEPGLVIEVRPTVDHGADVGD